MQTRPLRERGTLTVGVNSFGFGGANAHVILQSSEGRAGKGRRPAKAGPCPRPLRQDRGRLEGGGGRLREFLQTQPKEAFYDIAYTAALRRERLPHRAVAFGASPAAAADALRRFAGGEDGVLEAGQSLDAPSGPAFVYSGNGAQWPGMGRRLLKDPVFAKAVRRIDAVFRRLAGYSLEDELAGRNGECRYAFTEHAQPRCSPSRWASPRCCGIAACAPSPCSATASAKWPRPGLAVPCPWRRRLASCSTAAACKAPPRAWAT